MGFAYLKCGDRSDGRAEASLRWGERDENRGEEEEVGNEEPNNQLLVNVQSHRDRGTPVRFSLLWMMCTIICMYGNIPPSFQSIMNWTNDPIDPSQYRTPKEHNSTGQDERVRRWSATNKIKLRWICYFLFFWATYLGLSKGEFEVCQMSYQQTLIGSIARVYRMSEKRKEARVKIKIEAHMSYV